MDQKQFNVIVTKVIDSLEGGYYHPDMLTDGRIKDSRYASSGETMFGIDRKAGGSINTTPAGVKFWNLIDNAKARTKWQYNYRGGPLESQLKPLVGDMIYPEYTRLSTKYLSPEAKKIVDSSDALTFHFAYATWNGAGWFQKFANDINKAVASGVKDPVKLTQVAVDSRTKEGLKPGSPPNSLIAQGGAKISGILDEMNKMLIAQAKFVKKNWLPVLIVSGLVAATVMILIRITKKANV